MLLENSLIFTFVDDDDDNQSTLVYMEPTIYTFYILTNVDNVYNFLLVYGNSKPMHVNAFCLSKLYWKEYNERNNNTIND